MMVLEAGGMIGGRPVQYRGHRYTLSYMVERKKVPNKKNRAQSRKKIMIKKIKSKPVQRSSPPPGPRARSPDPRPPLLSLILPRPLPLPIPVRRRPPGDKLSSRNRPIRRCRRSPCPCRRRRHRRRRRCWPQPDAHVHTIHRHRPAINGS